MGPTVIVCLRSYLRRAALSRGAHTRCWSVTVTPYSHRPQGGRTICLRLARAAGAIRDHHVGQERVQHLHPRGLRGRARERVFRELLTTSSSIHRPGHLSSPRGRALAGRRQAGAGGQGQKNTGNMLFFDRAEPKIARFGASGRSPDLDLPAKRRK